MMIRFLVCAVCVLLTTTGQAQYAFESHQAWRPASSSPWKQYDKLNTEKKMHWTMTLPAFYGSGEDLTVQVTTHLQSDTSLIRIYRGKMWIQTMKEPFALGRPLGFLCDSLQYGDLNGDSLDDIKIMAFTGGTGIAMLNYRIVYLIQQENGSFAKVSFFDKMLHHQKERDFDGDGNYEIITSTLDYLEGHSYWTFNLYRIVQGRLVSVNQEFNYPIMVQYLYRPNYEVTRRLTATQMKGFARSLPDDYSVVR